MRKVKFFVSTGYSQTAIEEEFTIKEILGLDEEEFESEEELRENIEEAFEDWVFDRIDASWNFE